MPTLFQSKHFAKKKKENPLLHLSRCQLRSLWSPVNHNQDANSIERGRKAERADFPRQRERHWTGWAGREPEVTPPPVAAPRHKRVITTCWRTMARHWRRCDPACPRLLCLRLAPASGAVDSLFRVLFLFKANEYFHPVYFDAKYLH